MATEVTSISELSSDDVKEQQTILTSYLAETYPTIDIRHGVMHDLVQYINAIFAAKERTELERWKSARSLLAITEDPDIADEDSVDHILSNYNITRQEGTYAEGPVQIEFAEDVSSIVPYATEFTYNDLTFKTTQSYLIFPSTTSGTTIADRVLTKLDNGRYGCLIDLTAAEAGSASCLKRGTELLCTQLDNISSTKVYNNFSGGVDTETNEELLLKLKSGIATKCWGNRDNIKSLLINTEDLSTIVDISIVGMHDEEMMRDQVSLFPISTGGKVDIYAKSAPYITTVTVKLTATAIAKDIDYTTWSVTVPSTALPGMWRITAIEKVTEGVDSSVIELVSQEHLSNTTDLTADAASYSAYSGIRATFRLTADSDTVVGTVKDFNITIIGLPDIAKVQEVCSDRNIMPVNSDVLVKAAVPCIITANIKIKQGKGNTVSDSTINSIKNAVTTTINNKGFTGFLASSEIAKEVMSYLSTGQLITTIQLTGFIMGPTGILYRDANNKQIVIPDMPLSYITKNTTSFFSDVTYIDVETETIDE